MPDQPIQVSTSTCQENQFSFKKARRKFVNIGSLKGKWMKIKSKKGCRTDEDFARLLIKSLHRLNINERHDRCHTSRHWKRRNIKGSHRIITLDNDVWEQWRELKCLLQVQTNSQLATVLMNAWHDRAAFLKNLYEAQQSNQQSDVNDATVGKSSEVNQLDTVPSGPLNKILTETPGHIVKTECFNEESASPYHIVKTECTNEESTNPDIVETEYYNEESGSPCIIVKTEYCNEELEDDTSLDTEMDDLVNYIQTGKKLIKITEDTTGSSEKKGNRRKSSRVQSRGYRPDYASLDWINDDGNDDDDNETTKDIDASKNIWKMKLKQAETRVRKKSATDVYVTEDDEFTDDMESIEKTKIKKRKVTEDPDFVVSDIDDAKDLNESEENFEMGEGECLSDSEKSGNDKKRAKREIRSQSGSNNKRKRKKSEDDEWNEFVKKPKVKKETKRKESSEQQPEKKPWIHIKLEEHQEKYRIEIVPSFARKNRNVNITEELFKCLMCGRFKSTAKDLFEAHIEKHVNKVLECDQCTYVGRSEMEIVRHKMKTGHVSKDTEAQHYMCDICGLVLYTWDTKLSHMGREHDNPQFQCRYCGEKLVTSAKRQQHQRKEHSDHVRYCFTCETDYRKLSLEDFKAHQSNCTVAHQCQVCGAILASKSGLNYHLKYIHMNVRLYQCSTCPYAGKSAQRLREHEMTHKSVHPFSCDKCKFTCIQAYQLKSHMRTHSGEKPYKCSQCKFAAAWNVQLKEHTKIHGMENTVVCIQCDIVYRNQKALKMHEKRDHQIPQ